MKNINKKLIFISFIILGLLLAASPVSARDIANPPVIGIPQATTLGAVDIDQNSATLLGSVDPKNQKVNIFFKYGTSSSNLNLTINGPSLSTPSSIAKPVAGLMANTTYYFKI